MFGTGVSLIGTFTELVSVGNMLKRFVALEHNLYLGQFFLSFHYDLLLSYRYIYY